MVSLNHNITLLASNAWKRYFLIMTGEHNLWSDIKWNQRGMFSCGEQNSALQFWRSQRYLRHSLTLALTRKDKGSSTTVAVTFSGLWINRCTTATFMERVLRPETNPLSLPIHTKTLWNAQEDSGGYITWKKWYGLLLWFRARGSRRAPCGQSGEGRPHSVGSYVCYTTPDVASTVICLKLLQI